MTGEQRQCIDDTKIKRDLMFFAKSGLTVNIFDEVWVILPNNGKGAQICVGWVHSPDLPPDDRDLILDVFVYYARTKAASTASGIVCNVKPYFIKGIPSLKNVKEIWSGLKQNNKKGLNQFFGTLLRQGNSRFSDYHRFTSLSLDKVKSKALDPSIGALSDIEFDSLAQQINKKLQEFDWSVDRKLFFYQSPNLFGSLRNRVTNKLLLSIVRRPIQIALLKWSDLIPSGTSFNDKGIRHSDEIGTVGAQTLQLRVFTVKSKGLSLSRAFPERYPIHLSEALSKIMRDYKEVTMKGLILLVESGGCKVEKLELVKLMTDMPMFPDVSIFNVSLNKIDYLKSLFTSSSSAYHISETAVAMALKWVRIKSDRIADCKANSNRIRHTVLTRGAQDGLPAVQLAKITGVTVPAARHYIDLDYKSRLAIDKNYIGSDFLKKIFCGNLDMVSEDEKSIVDNNFSPVGIPRNNNSCSTCSAVIGRPLGCYGCQNFRPILEADHRSVLSGAEDKLAVNRSSLINPLFARSIEKLVKQIAWVKLTIAVCDDILERRRLINAQ